MEEQRNMTQSNEQNESPGTDHKEIEFHKLLTKNSK